MKKLGLVLVSVILLLTSLLVGCQGDRGWEGPSGPEGPQGPQGIQGLQGLQGYVGSQGEKGEEGERGPRGYEGEEGEEGDRGRTGVRGATGSQGEQGEQGIQGEEGLQGIQGEQGIQGIPGEQGIQGIPGLAGTDGTDGVDGVDGVDGADGGDGEDGILQAFLLLAEKNSSWEIVEGGAFGCLFYSPIGEEFGYKFEAYGLESETEYSLIYYADEPDRFDNWGGNNPGALIGTGTTNGSGTLSISEDVELDMSLPSSPDANIDEYNYAGDPDWYAHAFGAKIWLVPSDCYNEPEVDTWSPGRFLFETDLITYIDTDHGFYAD